ncbi:MAG: phosphonate C-P lyase system protein PhnG [Rhizobiaceae bacterium]|nr:phosphonate C-P lyase system protein PhnG [Rhizobiaceae bacterium]
MDKHHPHAPPRAAIIGTLARAETSELREAVHAHWPGLQWREAKPAEAGLVMLRGRTGGDGAAFNLGEATVARAVIDLETGERGHGQCLGRDMEKARLAAVFDALWQRETDRDAVERHVIAPVRARIARQGANDAARAAATRVNFFTLVRGED